MTEADDRRWVVYKWRDFNARYGPPTPPTPPAPHHPIGDNTKLGVILLLVTAFLLTIVGIVING